MNLNERPGDDFAALIEEVDHLIQRLYALGLDLEARRRHEQGCTRPRPSAGRVPAGPGTVPATWAR